MYLPAMRSLVHDDLICDDLTSGELPQVDPTHGDFTHVDMTHVDSCFVRGCQDCTWFPVCTPYSSALRLSHHWCTHVNIS